MKMNKSRRTLRVVVRMRIRMARLVKIECVCIGIDQHRLHLSVQNTTDQSQQTRLTRGETQIRNNLPSNPHRPEYLVGAITKPHGRDISGN